MFEAEALYYIPNGFCKDPNAYSLSCLPIHSSRAIEGFICLFRHSTFSQPHLSYFVFDNMNAIEFRPWPSIPHIAKTTMWGGAEITTAALAPSDFSFRTIHLSLPYRRSERLRVFALTSPSKGSPHTPPRCPTLAYRTSPKFEADRYGDLQ